MDQLQRGCERRVVKESLTKCHPRNVIGQFASIVIDGTRKTGEPSLRLHFARSLLVGLANCYLFKYFSGCRVVTEPRSPTTVFSSRCLFGKPIILFRIHSTRLLTNQVNTVALRMSAENKNVDSSSSDSDMEQDTQLKSGFRGEGEDILPNLPPVVKKRVKALKKLLVAQTDVDTKFYTELHILECKYHEEYVKFYNKRSDIVQGNYEPTEDECDFPSDDEDDVKDLSTDMEGKVKLEESKSATTVDTDSNDKIKGIPDFWLTILKNTSLISDMIQPHDEPILSHLTDVKVYLLEDPMGFALEFHFSPNEWFTNTVLTKEYEMKCVPDKNNPLSFEGPEIFKCKGCTIHWNKGKNVTVKVVKKKQKHKVKGAVRFVNKTIQNVSFFHFFSPPAVPDDPETEVDEEIDNLLTTDFEIGHYIRERIIPRAVLYFTGEALLEENDFDEDDEEEESENDDDEDDDEDEGTVNDPEYNPRQDKLLNKQVNPAECKQQ